jgi:hypothetical protein
MPSFFTVQPVRVPQNGKIEVTLRNEVVQKIVLKLEAKPNSTPALTVLDLGACFEGKI